MAKSWIWVNTVHRWTLYYSCLKRFILLIILYWLKEKRAREQWLGWIWLAEGLLFLMREAWTYLNPGEKKGIEIERERRVIKGEERSGWNQTQGEGIVLTTRRNTSFEKDEDQKNCGDPPWLSLLYQVKAKLSSGNHGQRKVLEQLLEGTSKAEQVQVCSSEFRKDIPPRAPSPAPSPKFCLAQN